MRVTMVFVTMALLWTSVASADYLCFAPSLAYGNSVSVDCTTYQEWQHLYKGYGETAEESCDNWGCGGGVTDCGCGMTGAFCWRISRSPTTLYDNVGPLTSDVLYLWLTNHWGWVAGEFRFSGSLSVESFVPLNGFRNLGTGGDILLLYNDPFECVMPGSLSLVGEIHLATPVTVEGESWGRVKAAYRN